MSETFQIFSAIFYSLFFYLYWVVRFPLYAGIAIISFIALSRLIKEMQAGLPLSVLVGVTHLLLWIIHLSPYLSWPLDFFIVALLGFSFLKVFFKENIRLNWSFKFRREQILSVAAINIPSLIILLWYFFENKEVAQQWPLPSMPIWAIPLVVILIALMNGLREEIFYRGLLQECSSKIFSLWFVIFFQAISFGFLHFMGAFPQGWLGVTMTAVWGSLIAFQYHYFRSISLAWLTHSVADAVMFTVILLAR